MRVRVRVNPSARARSRHVTFDLGCLTLRIKESARAQFRHLVFDLRSRTSLSSQELRSPVKNFDLQSRTSISRQELRSPVKNFTILSRTTLSSGNLDLQECELYSIMSESISDQSSFASEGETEASFGELNKSRSPSISPPKASRQRPSRQWTVPAKLRESEATVEDLEETTLDMTSEF